MIKQFERDLRYGLGRAYTILQSCDNYFQYIDVLERVMLNHIDYDFQSEGTRGRYFADIIHLIQMEDYFIDCISKKIFSVNEINYRVKSHLLDILYVLALNGNDSAKEIHEQFYDFIYNKINKIKIKESKYYYEFSCFYEIICQLLFFKDFAFVERVIKDVSLLPLKNRDCVDEYIFEKMAERFSKDKINKLLIQYKINYQVEKKVYPKNKIEPISLAEFMEGFENSSIWKKNGLALSISKSKKENLLLLSRLFENETSLDKRMYYLNVFKNVKYPGDIKVLINQYHLYGDYYDEVLVEALSKVRSKQVEKFAIRILEEDKLVALSILSNNINVKNIDLFLKKLNKINFYKKPTEYHFFINSLVENLHKNKLIEPSLLMDLFHAQQCSLCRYDIARRIIKFKEIAPAFLEELKHDCNTDVVLLMKKTKN